VQAWQPMQVFWSMAKPYRMRDLQDDSL